jgi:hypothetical protein
MLLGDWDFWSCLDYFLRDFRRVFLDLMAA